MTSKINKSASYAASQNFLQKKKTIKDLGKIAKDIGINGEADFDDIISPAFIKPNDKAKNYVAKSTDYCVFLIFNENMKHKIPGNLDDNFVDQAFNDFQIENFKNANLHKHMNFPSEVAGMTNAVMTFKEKSKTHKFDYMATPDKEVPMHIQDQLKKAGVNKHVMGSSTMALRPQSRNKMDGTFDMNDKNSVSFNLGTTNKKSSEENEPQSNMNGLAPGQSNNLRVAVNDLSLPQIREETQMESARLEDSHRKFLVPGENGLSGSGNLITNGAKGSHV